MLIIAEAMHDSAPADVRRLTAALAEELRTLWAATSVSSAVLSRPSPRFAF
ncbi:hypothetical protein [Streptomyces sp. ISL-100]|uniref:hypothetical protein n=1 Tax=Streptomyces sp. ISL-100 TaxID=2819173 RepID=UPI001BE64071|nr:hypothetical protein [Streptomyces sp. ISL-100]MBT2395886.1 hypothetical protein [Streptomyces sp. ISL-100]